MTLANQDVVSNYTGSAATYRMVAEQIKERWGEEEVERYDPLTNCLNFLTWRKKGYRIKKGANALKSTTFVEVKDKDGEVIKKYPRTVNLFYYLDTEKNERKTD